MFLLEQAASNFVLKTEEACPKIWYLTITIRR